MTDQLNRQQLFEDLANARQELMRSLYFLSDPETVLPGVHGEWCVRDVMSHITARECTAWAAVHNLVHEGDPQFPSPHDDRDFNQAAVYRRREFSLREIIDEMDGMRVQTLKFTRKMHNNELYGLYEVRATGELKSVAQVLQELLDHDYQHAASIWRWRAEFGTLHRSNFRRVLTGERNQLMNALGGMFDNDMLREEVCGYWTVRDVMAHVLSWDEEVLRTTQHWTEARPWQDGALYDDEWNESEVARRASMDLVELADGLATSHRRLMQLFDATTDQDLVTMGRAPWGERMALMSFLHQMAKHDAVHRPDLERMPRRGRR
jgi:uncharacterized damage-inducible protein DinB